MKWDGLNVPENDALFRGAHFPKAFQTDYRMYAPERALHLQHEPELNTLETSVVWQKLAPLEYLVHAFGCRLSIKRNSTCNESAPADIYCGAYQITVSRLNELCIPKVAELRTVDALHLIEDGEVAHANLRFHLVAGLDEDDIEEAKVLLIDSVTRVILGPLRHVCPNDRMVNHPSEKLPTLAAGAFRDTRSLLKKVADVIWFLGWLALFRLSGMFTGFCRAT